jgi:indolepyruvate decarboxylase
VHHNLPGTSYRHFATMAAEITVAQADLRPDNAAAEIDRVIATAVRKSRPVYLTIPADVVGAPVAVPAATLRTLGGDDTSDPAAVHAFSRHAASVLDHADTAAVLVGHLPARYRLTSNVTAMADAAGLPVAVLSTAKGDIAESDPLFVGLYAGAASAKRTRLAVEDSDVLITVGVSLADSLTFGATHQLPEAGRIDLAADHASVGAVSYPGIGLRSALSTLTSVLKAGHVHARPGTEGESGAHSVTGADGAPTNLDGQLTHRHLWASVQDFLQAGDLIIADQGTAFYGAASLTLPDGARLIGQPLWASIGWALPAALGTSLGAPDRRVIVIAGDGAMQQTAAELGTLLAQDLAPVIIVLNNDGYTIERAIHNPSARYHRIPQWDWSALPGALTATSSALTIRAASPHKLDRALRLADRNAGRLVFIEAVLAQDDAPSLLRDLARLLGDHAGEDGGDD